MFDAQFYTQKILPAADYVLRNNMNTLGQHFANEFMSEHDLNNGANPNVQRNASQLFNWVAQNAQRLNNGNLTVNDQQLFDIVGAYIKNVFDVWQRQMQPSGYSAYNQQPLGSTFNRPASFTGGGMGGFGQQRPQGGNQMNGMSLAAPLLRLCPPRYSRPKRRLLLPSLRS